MVTLQGLNM